MVLFKESALWDVFGNGDLSKGDFPTEKKKVLGGSTTQIPGVWGRRGKGNNEILKPFCNIAELWEREKKKQEH